MYLNLKAPEGVCFVESEFSGAKSILSLNAFNLNLHQSKFYYRKENTLVIDGVRVIFKDSRFAENYEILLESAIEKNLSFVSIDEGIEEIAIGKESVFGNSIL